MGLFYGKNNWVNQLGGGSEPPSLFKRKKPAPILDVEQEVAEAPVDLAEAPQEIQTPQSPIPLFKKRMMEDSHLSGGGFSDSMDVGRQEVDADKPIASNADAPVKSASLFGSNRPQRGPEMAQSDVDEYGVPIPKMKTGLFAKMFPGPRRAYEQEMDNYFKMRALREPTADIKAAKEYLRMSDDERSAFDKIKSMGSMSPLPLAKFQYDITRDQRSDALKEEERKRQELQLEIPGYERTGLSRVSDAEAAKLRGTSGELDNFEKSIQAMKDYTDKYGTVEAFGKGSSELPGLHSAIQMSLKNLHELGAITGPDMAILGSQLSEPNTIKAFFTKGSTKQAELDELLKNIRTKALSKLESSGYLKKGQMPPGAIGKVRGSDGKMHWTDKPVGGNDLGVAE